MVQDFLQTTGFAAITLGQAVLLIIGLVLIYLAIVKKYEPLLLMGIGFGIVLANLPLTGLMTGGWHVSGGDLILETEGGLLSFLYLGVKLAIFPPLIFLGIGALTDFGPLLANPKL